MKKYRLQKKSGKALITDPLTKWLEFFTNDNDYNWESVSNLHPIIRKAVHMLKSVSSDEQTRYLAHLREKAAMDWTSSINGARRKELRRDLKEEF